MTPTEIYQNRKAAGLCPFCGGKRENPRKSLCEKCLAYHRAYYRSRRERMTKDEKQQENARKLVSTKRLKASRRAQGLCVQCGAPSPVHWLCEVCYDKKKERGHENT